MNFTPIDFQTWSRGQYFHVHYNVVPNTYSITANIDISTLLEAVKDNGLKFYPVMIYCITTIVNRHDEFKMGYADNQIGMFDRIEPAYTIFHADTETYATLWTEYNADFKTFYDNCTSDIDTYKDERTLDEYLFAKPNAPANSFVITAIPWTSFTGFSHRMDNGSKYLAPWFTIGKYFEQEEKTLLPLAVHVNHAVCDGFHVSRFLNELQSLVDSLKWMTCPH